MEGSPRLVLITVYVIWRAARAIRRIRLHVLSEAPHSLNRSISEPQVASVRLPLFFSRMWLLLEWGYVGDGGGSGGEYHEAQYIEADYSRLPTPPSLWCKKPFSL